MSRYSNIDIGERSYIERMIQQNENVKKEVLENIDNLTLKLTHDTGATYVTRTRWHTELKNERGRVKYFEQRIKALKNKLERYESNPTCD